MSYFKKILYSKADIKNLKFKSKFKRHEWHENHVIRKSSLLNTIIATYIPLLDANNDINTLIKLRYA